MKRPIILSLIVLALDQLLKLYFQLNFDGKITMFSENFGFTYTTNPGLWINRDISSISLLIIQIGVILLGIFVFLLLRYYQAYYRKSFLIDLSFAFFVNAAFGNVILDRLFFGYIRDYFINPIAISNLADISSEIALVLLFIELVSYPKARPLLKIGTPKQWYSNVLSFINFVKGNDRDIQAK